MSGKACAGCGTANEADARFCEGCGSVLDRRCTACGTQASATARFCRSCGGSLDGPAPQAQTAGPTRKTVTVLFADLAGSTTFEEKVDAETAREVLGRYHTLLRKVAEHHRAGVVKYIGDGFMAVWGVPEVSAGDAEHAVEAAVELQERFVGLAARVAETHGESLALRVAVNTGEVVVGSGDADLVGDALNVAARLESQCPLGHVVVGEETWRATRGRYRYEPLNPVQVKGRIAPVSVYQWAGYRSEPADSVPFVGRTNEFRRLQTVLDDAVARRAARLVTVIGDPGVGKTRLAAEFAGSQQGEVVLQIRCSAEGTVALAPVVEVLRARDLEADIPAAVPERDRILRDLNGMTGGVAGSVEETFWALRRYFEVCAAHGPLILVLDDIQWADPLLLDFVEHLSEWVRDAPILMIALARPELRESRPELVTVGGWVGDAIRLGGLEPDATAELAARVLGSDQLPADLLARLPSSTGGNPLFVRELVAMLVHDGVLIAQANGWRLTIDVDAIAVPPTIQALLASRLERMNTADRRVLETASVIGTDFSPAAVSALSGATPADVRGSLERLRRVELVQHSGTYTGDEPVWRFHHILIRDVAYRRLLKSDRAELHERFADWISDGAQNGVFESDELVARHLESAHGYRRELGARDSQTAELALRSARCYLSAARRALERDALVSAGAQAARGAALAASDAALRAELLLVGCEAFLSAGDVSAGAPLVDELDRVSDETLKPWATCYRCQYLAYTDPSRLPEIDGRLQSAIDEFAHRGDHAGSAKAYRVRAHARARLGRIGECEADLFEALIAARQGSDHRQITAALGAAPNAALWGPSPAPKAGGRCLDVVRMQRMTTAAPSLEATSLRCLAVLELLRGRPDKARSMLADAREIVSELGLRHGLMETALYAGLIESMVGDPVAAEPHFRTALEGLDSLGVGADAGQAAALLARSLLAQGRIDEADRYAAESERIAGHNLKTAIGWRAVRAEILSAQGRHGEAVVMARDAVQVAAETDLVLDYADACMTLSRVLADSGDSRAAAAARSKSESLYAAKDAVFLVGAAARPAGPPPAAASTTEAVGRLKVVNRACDVVLAGWQSLQLVEYAEGFVYSDHRNVSGDALHAPGDFLAAAVRKQEQYPNMEATVLAVRGQTLALIALRWWDDAGNETMSLDLHEIDESDRLGYHGRFDEDDFAGAYVELEKRFYEGEGKPFAANGMKVLAFEEAFWAQDIDAAGKTVHTEFRWSAAASALKPGERSLEELFAWRAERVAQVASFRDWLAALRWLSTEVCISRCEIRATGSDGEQYGWSRFYVTQYRDGLSAAVREFDIDDEDAAFAYAESMVGRKRSRLVVRNRASVVADGIIEALSSNDGVRAAAVFADDLHYDDRRRLGGNAVTSKRDYVGSLERLRQQYSHFENQTLAVRGERTALVSSLVSDHAGNEAAYLHVFELDEQGLISYEGRFDEDDFAAAYRVLEERHYAGDGAAFAVGGLTVLGFQTSIWAQDVDAARLLVRPDFAWRADPSTLKPAERSLEEMFTWRAERLRQCPSFRDWLAALQWLSPDVCVARSEMRETGHDGEGYDWSRVYVTEYRDGLMASGREFDIADEDEAFAYAESLVGPERTRLVVRNRASVVADGIIESFRANDSAGAGAFYAESLTYDDRRSLGGNAVTSRRDYLSGIERLLSQYSYFDHQTLAVRGERLALEATSISDAAGNATGYLHLFELDAEDLVTYEGRFDADDFHSAYVEFERRYYAGEGAALAANGRAAAGWVEGIGRRDIEMVRRLSTPDFRWFASRSSLKAAERTVDDMFEWLRERGQQVVSQRHWCSAYQWLSATCAVGLVEVSAIGIDGELYLWTYHTVSQFRDGLIASIREFDTEDEAFAYAESVVAPASRLAVANRASAVNGRILAGMQAGDLDATADHWADRFVYHDRRTLSGEPITTRAEMRDALERIIAQYSSFQSRVLAVRGERISLAWHCWSDSDGNHSTSLTLGELGEDDRVIYQSRFDEDDFLSAYVDMEHRYYAGEGAAYAESGATLTELVIAGNRGDLDKIFGELYAPDIRIESHSRTIIPNRTARELRSSYEEFNAMVARSRVWNAAVYWMSPTVAVVRQEREAVGLDGEKFEWSRIYVGRREGGRVTVLCEFDVEFEDQAFAYAEELSRAAASRLAVTNRAAIVGERVGRAFTAGDLDLAVAQFSSECAYEDRRRLGGDPIGDQAARRAALERIQQQFNRLHMVPLAVRGNHLVLERVCRSDDSGNESTVLVLGEIGDDERIHAYISFDEGDFDGAYAEMERRYYAGEGADAAAAGATMAAFVTALNDGGMEQAFRLVKSPDLMIETRSRAVFPDRTAAELRDDLEQLVSMTSSVRWWYSALTWLSPTCCVFRQEREAAGEDGERYAWTDIYAVEFRGAVPVWVCRFNIEDEAQAFADAEERMRLSRSRLAVTNRASEVRLGVTESLQRGDIEAAAAPYTDDLVYEDDRGLRGDVPVGQAGLHAALKRLRQDYTHFGGGFLAVRGERLALGEYVCSDDAGNQTSGLLLTEIDDDGRIVYEGRFDEDDFETAYDELERRYCAGEGAGFADFGMTIANYFAARNRGDLDTLFNSLTSPDLRLESRSRSVFVVRSAAEHRASIEELGRLVGSARDWASAVQHISPNWGVCRYQREALGRGGEDYRWERIAVAEVRWGRLHFVCDFDLDDEEAAFAYAEDRARGAESRLAVTNRAAEILVALGRALSRGDAEAAVAAYREDYRRDDRRRLAGELLRGKSAMRAAVDRMLQQFNHFQWSTLAVRGQGLVMGWTRWWDDSGNISTYLVVVEIDGDGRIVYEGRFDEHDFDSAYRELDARFSAGEGNDFAVNIPMQAAFFEALNRLDREAARKACLPSFRVISPPTTLATVERSFDEFYAWIAERALQVPELRHWMSVNHLLSADCFVSRIEIRAIGPEGDEYSWPRLAVAEIRGGRIANIRQFEIDDEAGVFAYAEDVLAKHESRLPLTNITSEVAEAGERAMKAGDIEGVVDMYPEDYVFDDHRRLSGDLLRGRAAIRAAVERLLTQFSRFESRTLAVRGMRLALGWSRWSDAAGNQTEYLHVFETGEDGRIVYDGRFDEDDFDSAYAELERRYYAGEGAAVADSGRVTVDYVSAMNRGDFDAMFTGLTRPDFRLVNRSRSAFPDRSADELRSSLEDLYSLLSSVRTWFPSIRWISPTTLVMRMEREGTGRDGEPYAWSRILVSTWKDSRLASLIDFDADDEDAAFAYAEEI